MPFLPCLFILPKVKSWQQELARPFAIALGIKPWQFSQRETGLVRLPMRAKMVWMHLVLQCTTSPDADQATALCQQHLSSWMISEMSLLCMHTHIHITDKKAKPWQYKEFICGLTHSPGAECRLVCHSHMILFYAQHIHLGNTLCFSAILWTLISLFYLGNWTPLYPRAPLEQIKKLIAPGNLFVACPPFLALPINKTAEAITICSQKEGWLKHPAPNGGETNKKENLSMTYPITILQLQYNLILSLKYFVYSTLNLPTSLTKHNKRLAPAGAYVGKKEYWNILFLRTAREGFVTTEVIKWHLHFSGKQTLSLHYWSSVLFLGSVWI